MSDHIPELVAGVRNPATLSVCKDHADAVYFSIDRFSLRARARDFSSSMAFKREALPFPISDFPFSVSHTFVLTSILFT